MITAFSHLRSAARHAQISGNHIVLSWSEALTLAERGERLERELDNLKRDVEQIRILKHGIAAKEMQHAPKHTE